jgi:hypothetical protein
MRFGQCLAVCVVFVCFALSAALVRAERPNASSASAGACSALSDATPSLKSICVNYCEKRDCVNSEDPECDNLLANYDRRRRDSDPGMPCLVTCPCFTAADLRDHPVELVTCYQSSSGIFSAIADAADTSGAGAGNNPRGLHHCMYTNFVSDDLKIFAMTSPEEAAMCIEMIDAEIAYRGFTCSLID